MGEYLTPEEARTIELPRNPFTRSKRIRELAEPLGGLSITTEVLGTFDIPTRKRLVQQAWQAEYDAGIRDFAEEYGVDEHLAAIGYGLCRLEDKLNSIAAE